jgi:hypothetical protein
MESIACRATVMLRLFGLAERFGIAYACDLEWSQG